jgi:hypothetical protein
LNYTNSTIGEEEDGARKNDRLIEIIPKELTVRDLSADVLFLLDIMNLLVLLYPVMACAYSKCIYDCRQFSVPNNRRQNNDTGARVSPSSS